MKQRAGHWQSTCFHVSIKRCSWPTALACCTGTSGPATSPWTSPQRVLPPNSRLFVSLTGGWATRRTQLLCLARLAIHGGGCHLWRMTRLV